MTSALAPWLPWNDRGGRLSWLKLAAFAATIAPALWLAWAAAHDLLGAKAVMAAVHEAGDWAIRLLLASLAITPLRRILASPRVGILRRQLGLAALAYALLHLALYAVELNYDIPRVFSEIFSRVYLMIGFAALFGLCVLGATSTEWAIRKMGQRWGQLHQIVYGIVALSVLHFFLQSKINVSEATLMAGLFVLLLLYRGVFAAGLTLSPVVLAGLAVLAGLCTAGIEYLWYALATGVPPARVFAANLRFPDLIRPAWWVLLSGLAVALLPWAAMLWRRAERALVKPKPKRVRRLRAAVAE